MEAGLVDEGDAPVLDRADQIQRVINQMAELFLATLDFLQQFQAVGDVLGGKHKDAATDLARPLGGHFDAHRLARAGFAAGSHPGPHSRRKRLVAAQHLGDDLIGDIGEFRHQKIKHPPAVRLGFTPKTQKHGARMV